jgi:hypothetical protein
MNVKFECKNCDQKLEADHDLFGQRLECPSCLCDIIVPTPYSDSKWAYLIENSVNNKYFYFTVDEDDDISIQIYESMKNVDTESKLLVAELKYMKKHVRILRSHIKEQLQNIKQNYRNDLVNKGSMFPGRGMIFRTVRAFQQISRENIKIDHMNTCKLYDDYLQIIDNVILSIDKIVLQCQTAQNIKIVTK